MTITRRARITARIELDNYYAIPAGKSLKEYLETDFREKLSRTFGDAGWFLEDLKVGDMAYRVWSSGPGFPASYEVRSFQATFIITPGENAKPLKVEKRTVKPGEVATGGIVLSMAVLIALAIFAMWTAKWAIIDSVAEIIDDLFGDGEGDEGNENGKFPKFLEMIAPLIIAVLVLVFLFKWGGDTA